MLAPNAVEEHNAFAGQGAVVLDIGGDIGALVVEMPAALDGVEIEIRPVGAAARPDHAHDHRAAHDHGQGGAHAHTHAFPHVAVVARPTESGVVASAVFAELATGEYELYERIGGAVQLRAAVTGGEVSFASWPV